MTTYYGPDWERRCKEAEADRDRLTDNIASDKLFIKNLLAERDRLAAALREIAEMPMYGVPTQGYRARAALGDRTEQP